MSNRTTRADWGSVTELERGRRYRLRYWAETPDGYRRCSETVRGTRREAYDRLARLRLDHSRDAPCPTVGQAWEGWVLPEARAQVERGDASPQSQRQRESVWRLHVAPEWAEVPLDQVTPLAVQQWAYGLTHSNACHALPLLRRVMREGVLRGLVAANPCDAGIALPSKTTSARRDDGIWGLDELGRIWEAAYGQWWECAFLLSAFGSARVGESLGPWAEDVEAFGGCALVRLNRQVSNLGGPTDRLKNEWSRRLLVIPGPMGRRMLELADGRSGWLTGDGLGGPTTQGAYGRSFREAVRGAGVADHPVKNLRPSWETYAHWTLRVPQDVIERLMGHVPSGSRVTAEHYDRPRWEEMARIVAACYAEHPFADGWAAAG